jgi:mono/diheme cytochrome c family protein
LLFLLIAVTSASAQDKDLIAAGQQEFRHSCVVCHGLTGKGESVMTTLNLLAIKPPDLRQLRKRNKGTFPFWQMYRVIDGRQEILAHGSRDMPMWGTSLSVKRTARLPMTRGRLDVSSKYSTTWNRFRRNRERPQAEGCRP